MADDDAADINAAETTTAGNPAAAPRRPRLSKSDRRWLRIVRVLGAGSTRDRLKSQRPRVERLVREAAAAAGLEPPLVVSGRASRGRPNAAAVSLFGHRFVIVDRNIADRLDDRELGAVLAHEMSHLKRRHSLRHLPGMISQIGLRLRGSVAGAGISGAFVLGATGLMPWGLAMHAVWALWQVSIAVSATALVVRQGSQVYARRHEAQADRDAMQRTHDPLALASALLALQPRATRNVKAMTRREDAHVRAMLAAQPGLRGRILHTLLNRHSDHPATHDRIRDLVDAARAQGSLPEGSITDASELAHASRAAFGMAESLGALETIARSGSKSDVMKRMQVASRDHGPAGKILAVIAPSRPDRPAIVEVGLSRPVSAATMKYLNKVLGEIARPSESAPPAYVVARTVEPEAATLG